jgi:hypothetical protein
MSDDLHPRSRALLGGPSRAPARAMFKAVGFTDDDLRRPLVGVANTWMQIGPCNFCLRRLAARVKEGIRAAGGTPMEFNTDDAFPEPGERPAGGLTLGPCRTAFPGRPGAGQKTHPTAGSGNLTFEERSTYAGTADQLRPDF